jgi:hypothetical protein
MLKSKRSKRISSLALAKDGSEDVREFLRLLNQSLLFPLGLAVVSGFRIFF